MKYTIIADSSCDLKTEDIKSTKLNFSIVPLSIIINDKNIIDDETLDTKEFVKAMKANTNKPLTACPSPEAFAEKMRAGNENIFCFTITSKLSGTYNSACVAAEMVKKEDPKKNIFVVDSLSTSCGMIIMINELIKLIESEKYTFSELSDKISKIRSDTRVRFLLQDFGNLIKTGRMSKVQAVIASVLKFKLICGENGEGEIKQYAKAIGIKKAVGVLSNFPEDKIREKGKDTPIVISHCHNEEDANLLKSLLESKYGATNINIVRARGLVSFYANDKGLLIGY